MDDDIVQRVRRRAVFSCEYCRLPEAYSPLAFEIDHIIARKHRGATVVANLALACFACNNHKGPNIAGIDPSSGNVTRLFHPRRHKWSRHFRWDGPILVGRTPIGRTTIAVLEINLPYRVAFRRSLMMEGVLPPE
jgi:HNH endonuclease